MSDGSATPADASTTPMPAPPFPLLAHLDGLMTDLAARVPAALNDWEPEAIHQSRVATRRMKAALDLMRPVLSNRPRRRFGRVMRNLRRRLGPLRDADVMLEHLQELGAKGERDHSAATRWLAERFCGEREQLRAGSQGQSSPVRVLVKLGTWDAVRGEVADAREAIDTLLAESLHLQLDAFAEQADRLVGAAPGAAANTDGAPGPPPEPRQDPHELRISGKALRYTLDMAAVQGHDLPGSLTKTFKKMQESLGLWHDYVVLGDRATRAALDALLSHHEPELMRDILRLLGEVLDRSSAELDRFKRLWTEEGDGVARSIRQSFPLTRPSPPPEAQPAGPAAAAARDGQPFSESQTDHDPSGSGSRAERGGCPPAAASDA